MIKRWLKKKIVWMIIKTIARTRADIAMRIILNKRSTDAQILAAVHAYHDLEKPMNAALDRLNA